MNIILLRISYRGKDALTKHEKTVMHLAVSLSPSDCMAPWWEFETEHDEQKAATCSVLPGHALHTHST